MPVASWVLSRARSLEVAGLIPWRGAALEQVCLTWTVSVWLCKRNAGIRMHSRAALGKRASAERRGCNYISVRRESRAWSMTYTADRVWRTLTLQSLLKFGKKNCTVQTQLVNDRLLTCDQEGCRSVNLPFDWWRAARERKWFRRL